MDENKNDTTRVTRARTRRLSTLDTEPRSATPLFDMAADRASPRPLRRTRLNSSTIDLRTPTRTTRLSIARGETPEPETPIISLSAKRATRTYKILKEEANDERETENVKIEIKEAIENDIASGRSTPTRSVRRRPLKESANKEQTIDIKMEVVEEILEQNNTSGSSTHSSMAVSPTEDKRITRSMSKTPPGVGSTINNTPRTQFDINNSSENNNKLTKDKEKVQIADEVAPVVEETLVESKTTFDTSILNISQTKLQVKVKDVRLENSKAVQLLNNSDVNTEAVGLPDDQLEDKIEEMETVAMDMKDNDNHLDNIATSPSTSCLEMQIDEQQNEKSTIDIDKQLLTEDEVFEKEESMSFTESESSENDKESSSIAGTPETPKEQLEIPFTSVDKYDEISKVDVSGHDIVKTNNPVEKSLSAQNKHNQSDNKIIDSTNEPADADQAASTKQNGDPSLSKKNNLSITNSEDTKIQDNEMAEAQQHMVDSVESSPTDNNKFTMQPLSKSLSINAHVIEDIRLAKLTPKTMSNILTQDTKESKKKVGFGNIADIEEIKPTYPKTPSRPNMHYPTEYYNLTGDKAFDYKSCAGTPVETKALKKRLSSTPLLDELHGPTHPPAQIDAIKPLANEEFGTPEVKKDRVVQRRLISEDEDEDGEFSHLDNEYLDNDVVVVDNYQSGDSMDSSERREIIENEIQVGGESLGSEDTSPEGSEDSAEERLSFIVSDHSLDESLKYTSDEELMAVESKRLKKRQRIVIHDSSDEEQDNQQQADEETVEPQADKSVNKSIINEPIQIDEEQVTPPPSPERDLSDDDDDAGSDVDELMFSSEEEDVPKPAHTTILEVGDSEDESVKKDGNIKENDLKDKQPSSNDRKSLEQKVTESYEQQVHPSPDSLRSEGALSDELKTSQDDEMESVSESVLTQAELLDKQTREGEAALLAELSSCDLSHLQQMFNPLQKSRRQTLYIQGREPALTETKSKLKRRSEILSSDVLPSQSFIETLAAEKQLKAKRKRLSKSFCGTADDLDLNALEEVQSKKARTSIEPESTQNEMNKLDLPAVPVPETVSPTNHQVEPKDRDYYMDYCDTILQAANEAKLEQKKQRVAAGKTTKRQKLPKTSSSAVVVKAEKDSSPPTYSRKTDNAPKLKKDVKRLQAVSHAMNRASQLLMPDLKKQSLSQKLLPQPEISEKSMKSKPVKNKNVKPKVSPVKSSDEENHHSVKMIKNAAGYVVITDEIVSNNHQFEMIRTNSGLVRVEPSTPKQKYFKEIPGSPQNRCSGFKEMASTPVISKKKTLARGRRINSNQNSATESALRFKRQIFGRCRK